MSGPGWLADLFAAVMIVVAGYSVGRLVAAWQWSRPTHFDVDVSHVLTGTAMTGMLVSALNPIPSGVWEIIFAVLAAWFVWRCSTFVTHHGVAGRDEDHVHHLSHYGTHLVMAVAMLYMYLAAATPAVGSASSGMSMRGATGTTADFVGLPMLFLFVLLASGIWELDGIGRFSPLRGEPAEVEQPLTPAQPLGPVLVDAAPSITPPQTSGRDAGAPWLAPRLEAGCHIAMCITMAYMLVLML